MPTQNLEEPLDLNERFCAKAAYPTPCLKPGLFGKTYEITQRYLLYFFTVTDPGRSPHLFLGLPHYFQQ